MSKRPTAADYAEAFRQVFEAAGVRVNPPKSPKPKRVRASNRVRSPK